MLNKLLDMFGRRKSVEQDLAVALNRAAEAINKAVAHMGPAIKATVKPQANNEGMSRDLVLARVALGVPPRRMPVEPPVRKNECQVDERCGFPLHLPEGAGPTYPPHLAVKVSNDGTAVECLDCGEKWVILLHDTPPTCQVRDPMKYMHEVGFTDFPFNPANKTRTEVTSGYLPLERAARQFMSTVQRRNEGARYVDFWTSADASLMAESFRDWLRDTPFMPNEQGPRQELARLVAAHMTFLRVDPEGKHTKTMCEAIIAWCDRNPLD